MKYVRESSWQKAKKVSAAFIVGAGAVENAWTPVISAIQPRLESQLNPDTANCYLARMVYLLRYYKSVNDFDSTNNSIELAKAELKFTREAICKELKLAHRKGIIRVRPQFNKIIEKVLMPNCNTFMFVTTNWDKVVNEALIRYFAANVPDKDLNLYPLHIHGSVDDASTLYLPTELTKEPYRTKEEDNKLGTIHTAIMDGLDNIERVVLYGISMSPLDAELTQTLAAGWDNKRLKTINIVDPNHALIAERVKVLLNNPAEIIIKGYDPNQLDVPINHSINKHLRSYA